jgi:hypothetical protein
MMGIRGPKSINPRSWSVFVALLCVGLILAFGVVQAVHVHQQGQLSHADCALCATAHHAVQVSAVAVAFQFTPIVAKVETFVAPGRSATLFVFALITRPPPPDAVLV